LETLFFNQDLIIIYIENQKEHHRITSFEDELKALLIENGIEFDEKYLFDECVSKKDGKLFRRYVHSPRIFPNEFGAYE